MCVAPKIPAAELTNEEREQMLCNKLLEGVNKKHLIKEIKASSKKKWWEKITTSVMGFEDMLCKSEGYINIAGDGERIDFKRQGLCVHQNMILHITFDNRLIDSRF